MFLDVLRRCTSRKYYYYLKILCMKTKLNKQTYTLELSQELVILFIYFYEYILLPVFFPYNMD